MRRVISEIVDASPEFQVVGTARNGHDALRQIHTLEPDIVTLDVGGKKFTKPLQVLQDRWLNER